MKKCIIIRGSLGVGKTTASKKLAEEIGATYVSVDEVLAKLDMSNEGYGGIPLRNFLVANETIQNTVKDDLLVVEGNFYFKEQIEDLMQRYTKAIVFTLHAPVEVCIERDKHRAHSYGASDTATVHQWVADVPYGITVETAEHTVEDTVIELKGLLHDFLEES